MGGIHRIVAAVVKEVADVVGAEYLDQPLVLGAVLVDSGELVARRAESAARRVAQGADRRGGLLAGVDHVLGERADDAVPSRIELADLAAVLAGGLDDPAGGCIDDGGNSAGLGVEGVFWGRAHDHECLPRIHRRAG